MEHWRTWRQRRSSSKWTIRGRWSREHCSSILHLQGQKTICQLSYSAHYHTKCVLTCTHIHVSHMHALLTSCNKGL
jgi:hypothetical protein